ncbi:MAG: hypothetical protein WCJ57_04290 [Candidatus Falkowbacteria bacterium]
MINFEDNIQNNKINKDGGLRQYLRECLGLNDSNIEKIESMKAKDLSKNYQTQFEVLNDSRLNDVVIAIIPDDLWKKGSQPSESFAEKQLISMKKSYFETQEKSDEIAWMIHELAHCQSFLNSETVENYQKNMQTAAFDDLEAEYFYPNNLVEQHAFTKQFEFLKEQGKSRDDIVEMINKYYHKEDLPFFDRLLDDVYGNKV